MTPFKKTRSQKVISCHLWLLMLFAAMLMPDAAWAQRKNSYFAQIDLMGGGSNQIGTYSSSQVLKEIVPFFAAYPTAMMTSAGARSSFDASYTFGWDRYNNGDQILTTLSHVAGVNFSTSLSKSVRLQLSDSFRNAPEYSTISIFQGIAMTPEGFRYLFEPALQESITYDNNFNATLDVDVGAVSSLSFRGSSSYRHYDVSATYQGLLPDQLRSEAGMSYTRKISAHHSWSLRYTAAYSRYREYGNSLTHHTALGYSGNLSPHVTMTLEGGPSYTQSANLPDDYLGYNANFNISYAVRSNLFSLYAAHSSGDSTGIGSVSDTTSGGIVFARWFGRITSFNVNLNAFTG
jgi:hypothetical protein